MSIHRLFIALAVVAAATAFALPGVLGGSVARADTACPWMDTSKTSQQRGEMLVAAMTIDQKISLLHQHEWMTHYGTAGYVPGDATLCLPDLVLSDSGQGVGGEQVNTVAFAAPIAQTSTWDPNMQFGWGSHVGWEAWHKGIDIHLAPAFNIGRVPMNGRNFEYMGEDPFLAGKGAAAATRGLQSQNVIATLKHYALNNHESNRMSVSADVDPRTAHEIYLAPFETAVREGQPGSVMCSYNRVNFVAPYASANSIYACEHPTLLTTYLKQEFGFDGWVMSDWTATHSTVAAALAGLDQEMSIFPGTFFAEPLKTAVLTGLVPQWRLDDMVLRIVRAMFRVGVFDRPPAAQPAAYAADVETPDEISFARTLAEQGTVLLKNDGALPLGGQLEKIAVIGRPAGPVGVLDVYNGGGSAHVPQFGNKENVVSPLQGIEQRALAEGAVVVYDDGAVPATAATVASAADVAIVFGYYTEAEGSDRANLSLDSGGDDLISTVAASQPNTVVVLNTGGPVLMPWLDQVKAVLEAWYPGQEYGNAIAALLFGDVNPSGKLPQTFPKSLADLPTQTPEQYPGVTRDGIPHAIYSEGLLVGYRWFDAKGIDPLFPFGHGLSYTTFAFSDLTVRPSGKGAGVVFTITNTGTRAGAEVGQVYVGFPSSAGEPPKQLKGFEKVFLQPGESQQVTISLDARAFSYWDPARSAWTVPSGSFTVMVGSSSRDLPLQAKVKPRR
jgi:beta-glucosidase